ncbi:MAG: hypothetical protein RI900_2816 [Actinomycetota bacterium]|jgi:hypothetical protein
MTNSKAFTCFCCLSPFLRVKLDKKSRPFLGCSGCGTMLFPRGGAWATAAASATARLLDNQANLDWVRTHAAEAASHGEASVLDLVRATAPVVVTASPAVAVTEAPNVVAA